MLLIPLLDLIRGRAGKEEDGMLICVRVPLKVETHLRTCPPLVQRIVSL